MSSKEEGQQDAGHDGGKEHSPPDGGKITIKVVDEHDVPMQFKVKPTTAFAKVFEHFCTKNSLQRNEVRFYFDGIRLNDDATPKSVDMKDADTIEVMRNQIGGNAQL